MLRYEILGKQRDTDIESGEVAVVESGLGKEVLPGFDIGATAYHMRQTSREKGAAPGTDTSLYRASALGPEVNWRTTLPGFQLAFRSYYEFGARTTSEVSLTA